LLSTPPPAHLEPRAVDWRNALRWYEDAMRLVKRAPAMWAALAFLTLAAELGLQAVPEVGPMLGKIVVPLIACGLLLAASACDRGERPAFAHLVAAFRAPAPAIAAIIGSSLVAFAAEALAAWWIADVNLLSGDPTAGDLTMTAVGGIYAIGILASLPVTFVPFHVLLEGVAPGAAFRASWVAFTQNTPPLLAYAAASFVLLAFGLATMGIGLVLVLPLWAASSYAAWKDVFAVTVEPPAPI
jgi:uncharacterized membrane protein